MVNVLEWDLLVSKFELFSHDNLYFRKNTFEIVPLFSFYKNGFGIKWTTKIDMP